MTNNLYSKVAEVSKAIGALQPDKRNTQQNYDYISADQILTVCNREMAKVGLTVVPAMVDERMEAVTYDSRGREMTRYDCRVDFEMKIADTDGNEDVYTWFGRGSDYAVPDKAMYKAITSGHKYFLMKLFNVGVGNEDGEHEAPPNGEPAKQPQQAKQPQPTKNGNGAKLSDATRRKLHAIGTQTYGDGWNSKRADMSAAFGVGSSNDWTEQQAQKVIDGMTKILNERAAKNQSLFDDEPAATGAYAE